MPEKLERATRYRARAEELLRQHERQTDERRRAVLLDLAVTYHRIAKQIEELDRLDSEPNTNASEG